MGSVQTSAGLPPPASPPRFAAGAASPRGRVWRHRLDLMVALVDRELKLLYHRSFVGIAWTFINPLLQLAVFSVVFRVVLGVQVPRYSAFAFSGLLAWTWFQSSLVQATGLITGNRALVRQPGFALEVLPLVTVGTGLIHYALSVPILFGFLLSQEVELTPWLLLLPVLMVLQFAFTAACAYPLAALNVRFRDIQHVLGVVLQLAMYLTPIFYSVEQVPEHLRKWFAINPMVALIEAYRAILIYGQPPPFLGLGVLALLTALLLVGGIHVFRNQSRRFAEEL